jgi:hypothetical protein
MINKYLYYLLRSIELALYIITFFAFCLYGVPWLVQFIINTPIGY